MNTPRDLPGPGRVCVALLALAMAGCPKKEQEPDAAKAVAKADPAPEATAEPADSASPDPEAADADPADPHGGSETGKPGEPAAAEAGADEGTGDTTHGQEDAAEPAGPDPGALLKTAVNRRTSDDEAKRLLGEAEEAGAPVRQVARAAVDRGLALHATPDRAKAFFEWAAEKDPKFPDPSWQLARQAAIEGDVDRAKELLVDVKKRGGKKLLQQIDFDPMWEIVKDDPDVRKLL